MKRIITYGSFDLLHYGHIELLRRAKAMGDYLIVALSTDEFSASKGKRSYFSYEQRKAMLEAIRYVDMVVPEQTWSQKSQDVRHRCLRHRRRLDRHLRRAARRSLRDRLPPADPGDRIRSGTAVPRESGGRPGGSCAVSAPQT